MRVIIIGGGLSGVTLAAALTARGVEFDLVERTPEFEPAGAGIALMPPALRIGAKLGVLESLEAASCPLSTMSWLTRTGSVLQEFVYASVWQGREVRSIHRSSLHEVLLASTPHEKLILDEAVCGVSDLGDRVEVRTENGRTLHGDVAVGADGIQSVVRRNFFGGAPPRFLGTNYWRAALAGDRLVESYTSMVARGRTLGLVPLGDGRTHFFAQVLSAEPLRDATDGRVERLRRRFEDFAGPAAGALALLKADGELHFGHGYEAAPVETPWNGSRVVLIGDAFHASAPTLGLWGAMAMEDAWVLAEELATQGLAEALGSYCRRRGPRIRWVEERTRAWIQRMESPDQAFDPSAIYRADYEPLLAEP
jgi:2-polyprenyl-6-methoxyphenol hydroxylase-like FAD-dependent oxidoreductase